MRLSLNQSNLSHFIGFMRELIQQLTDLCLKEMQAMSQQEETLTEWSSKDYTKIVNLMNIFFEMVTSFKNYPTDKEQHSLVMGELRKTVEIDSLQELCEIATNHLFNSSNVHLQAIMGEIMECYFVLY